MFRHLDAPPLWLLLSAIIAWLLAEFVPIVVFVVPDLIGWLILVAGLTWAASASVLFVRHKTSVIPGDKPTTLITGGPFRLNRNPIYTGMTAMLLGWAVVLGTVTAFLPAIIFPFLITRRFIIEEEEKLREAFGTHGHDFLSRTRRW